MSNPSRITAFKPKPIPWDTSKLEDMFKGFIPTGKEDSRTIEHSYEKLDDCPPVIKDFIEEIKKSKEMKILLMLGMKVHICTGGKKSHQDIKSSGAMIRIIFNIGNNEIYNFYNGKKAIKEGMFIEKGHYIMLPMMSGLSSCEIKIRSNNRQFIDGYPKENSRGMRSSKFKRLTLVLDCENDTDIFSKFQEKMAEVEKEKQEEEDEDMEFLNEIKQERNKTENEIKNDDELSKE